MKRVGGRVARGLGLALSAGVLAVALGFALLAWQVDRLGQRDDARRSDVIVVLGARVEPDGRPSSDLSSRIAHAVEVWKAGQAPNLVCTGGFKNERLSAAAVCQRAAIQLGVPAERIFLADGTSNTAEDAHAAARVMAERGWRTAILVSHPLHLFRARWLFERAGVAATTSPTSTQLQRIAMPLRLFYTAREAGAIVATLLESWGWLPAGLKTQLQEWSHELS
jgi:uncharacterized SAM-binding protein YcdF (DUF218 family)